MLPHSFFREVFLVLRMPDTDEGAQRRSKLADARAPAKQLAMESFLKFRVNPV
jgi:hypothetical protein